MDFVSPAGPVYQAGTLSGNPIAMSAGLAMLTYLNEHPEVYQKINATGLQIVNGIKASMQKLGLNYSINHLGSMYSLFFTQHPVVDFESAKTSNTQLFGDYFRAMLKRGIYLAPSQYESLFISTAIGQSEIDQILQANEESLKEIHGHGL